jgi:Skp family chaperone for outer membrane proteins
MKRHLALLVFLATLSFAADSMASGELVFVNLDHLYRNFYRTKLAYTQLNAEAERAKAERATLTEEFDTFKERYEQLRAEAMDDALSEEIRSNKRNESEDALILLQEKANEIRETEQRANQQLQKQKMGMDKRLLEQIQSAITTEAQTKGYLGVMNIKNVGATALQAVMTVPYYDAEAEITEDILKLLNRGYQDADETDESAPVADDTEETTEVTNEQAE